MKRLFFVLSAVSALVLGAAPANGQQLKIGFVNSQRVLAETPGVAQAQQTLEREMAGLRASLDTLEQRLQQQQDDIQKQQATLTEPQRQQRQQQLQQQFQAYQQRAGQAEQQMQRRQAELVQPVMKQINDVIETLRREGGFTFIVDASQGGIVAIDPALDITDRVIQRLKPAAGGAGPRR